MVEISASLLSIDPKESIKTIYNLEVAHIDYFHIDVMDGIFVENNNQERMQEYTNQIKQISNLPIDVHLMVSDISYHIEEYIPYQPDRITFHYEACKTKQEVIERIQQIKENGIKVGLVINPKTPVEAIYEFLPYLHMVLVMTVEAGKGGQTFMQDMLKKVKSLCEVRQKEALEFEIEADGGIKLENIEEVKKAGVDIAVVGTGLIKTKDYKVTLQQFKQGK